MAKSIIKLTETLAIVKIVGAGTETISLATDLLSPTQVVSGTPSVGVNFIQWTTGGNIMIQRNSLDVFQLYTNTGEFDLSGNGGFIETTNSTHDIVVTVTTGGTCFLTLRKLSGYASKIEPEKFGQYDNTTVVGS